MTRVRPVGSSYPLLAVVLLAAVAAAAAAAAALALRPTAALAQPATSPAADAATTAPTTSPAGEEEESSEPFVLSPAAQSNDAEREFWIYYVGVPALTMLGVIAVGVIIIVFLRKSRSKGPNEPTTPAAP